MTARGSTRQLLVCARTFLPLLILFFAAPCFGQVGEEAQTAPPPLVRKVFEESAVGIVLMMPVEYREGGKIFVEYEVIIAGTGIVVAPEKVVAVFHVAGKILENSREARLYVSHRGETYDAEFIDGSPGGGAGKDIAVIRVFSLPYSRFSGKPIVFSRNEKELGRTVWSVRRAWAFWHIPDDYGEYKIAGYREDSYRGYRRSGFAKPEIIGGFSGAPVLEPGGRCVGMFYAADRGESMFIPAAEIIEFLKEKGIEARLGK